MSLKARGKSTLVSEVTNIGKTGFWLLYQDIEYFILFNDYPAFKNATVKEIYSMKVIGPGQLRWKELDCDIEIDALEKPEEYPLIYR
ncbi:MAG: hypothetical protein A2X59_09265 [Nitrospirae bacterium GWC2_42_7]|nr:MAG: hypothetical protein A2X59_09265 [Nitrospirae bacterium GWC2_42_7]